jgi:hypothetical protein
MAQQKMVPLMADPRWLWMVDRYADDIVRFACEVCSLPDDPPPSLQQQAIMRAIAAPRARVSVSSGHSTGKTFSLSAICFWHLTMFPRSHTLLTANDIDQLKVTFWKEFGKLLAAVEQGPFSWLAQHVEIMADASCRIRGYEDKWFVESKTANSKNANKLAGRHGEHYMVVADEAASIPDTVMSTLSGALSQKWNRMILTSQYVRVGGFFARTQGELSIEQGGPWTALQLSSADSPWMDDANFRELWDMYDDDERAVRLLGMPPQRSAGLMMSQRDAIGMYTRGRIIKPGEAFGWLTSADVGSGEGVRDKSANVHIKVTGWGVRGPNARRVEVHRIPLFTNEIRSNTLASHLMDESANLPGVTYVVDSGGLGINVCQDLEDANRRVIRVNWGNPCFRRENETRYVNLRAQAMHQAARAAKEGRLSILTDDFKRVMIAQSARIPKKFGNRSRLQVPEKHGPEWEGLPSPDLWDAVCFAFLEDVTYIGCGSSDDAGGAEGGINAAVERMRAARAALKAQAEAPA